jgi:hypothetical protein
MQGWGLLSQQLNVIVSMEPEQPAPVVTTVEGTNYKFSWLPPNDNFGMITSYIVLIQGIEEELTFCNGSLSTVVSSTSCFVPGLVLR